MKKRRTASLRRSESIRRTPRNSRYPSVANNEECSPRLSQPAPIGHFFSCTVATLPDTAPLVNPSAFVAVLVGFAALPNPTLILCFHLFRSGLEDNERMTASL